MKIKIIGAYEVMLCEINMNESSMNIINNALNYICNGIESKYLDKTILDKMNSLNFIFGKISLLNNYFEILDSNKLFSFFLRDYEIHNVMSGLDQISKTFNLYEDNYDKEFDVLIWDDVNEFKKLINYLNITIELYQNSTFKIKISKEESVVLNAILREVKDDIGYKYDSIVQRNFSIENINNLLNEFKNIDKQKDVNISRSLLENLLNIISTFDAVVFEKARFDFVRHEEILRNLDIKVDDIQTFQSKLKKYLTNK